MVVLTAGRIKQQLLLLLLLLLRALPRRRVRGCTFWLHRLPVCRAHQQLPPSGAPRRWAWVSR